MLTEKCYLFECIDMDYPYVSGRKIVLTNRRLLFFDKKDEECVHDRESLEDHDTSVFEIVLGDIAKCYVSEDERTHAMKFRLKRRWEDRVTFFSDVQRARAFLPSSLGDTQLTERSVAKKWVDTMNRI
jgi:hypothetical protein